MAGFYQIYLTPARVYRARFRERVEKKLNNALDWYRINDNLWVICTTQDAQTWYERLQPFVRSTGFMFISKLDIHDRQGWMPNSFWEWIKMNQDRVSQT